MTIVVEDGTGSNSAADSYLSVANAKSYWSARGFDHSPYADDEIESALRRATTFLDINYASRWYGTPTNGRTQPLAWPRSGITDARSGVAVAKDEIPRELKFALAEATAREVASPGSLMPDRENRRVMQEHVGQISIGYANFGDARPIATIIEELLGGLMRKGSATFLNRM